MTDSEYMKLLARAACEGIHRGCGPFAAAIVGPYKRDIPDGPGGVISLCSNEVTLRYDPTAHAEVQAIRKACHNLGTFDLKGYRLFTTCEPCPMCFGAIYWARLDGVVYGATREDARDAGFSDLDIYDELREILVPKVALLYQLGHMPESVPLEYHRSKPAKIPFRCLDRVECLEPFRLWSTKVDKRVY